MPVSFNGLLVASVFTSGTSPKHPGFWLDNKELQATNKTLGVGNHTEGIF